MQKKLIVLFFTAVIQLVTFAQDNDTSTILRSVRSPINDSNKVYSLIEYGYLKESVNLDSAMRYYNLALHLSEKIGFVKGELKSIANCTYILNQKGYLDSGLVLNTKALDIANESKNKTLIANSLLNVGSSYTNLNKHDKAIEFYLKAEKIYQVLNDTKGLTVVYSNIGGVLGNSGKNEKALPYFEKAIKLSRLRKDSLSLSSILINYGISLEQMNRLSESELYLSEGLTISRLLKNPYSQSQAILTLAEVYTKKGEYDKSIPISKNGLELTKKIDSKYGQMEALKIISRAYSRMGNTDSAIKYFNIAIVFGKTNGFDSDIYKLYDMLAYNYYLKKDYKLAYESLDIVDKLKDSLNNEEVSKKIEQLEISYKTAQKEKQILSLEREKQQKNLLIIGLASILLIAACLSFFIYKNIQNQKKIAIQETITKDNAIKQLQKEQQLSAANLIMQGQEEERTRLARDLHDGLGGLLSGIKFSITNNTHGNVAEKNIAILSQLDNAIVEMRRIAHSMMPEVLVQFGLNEALKDFCETLSASGKTMIHLQLYGLETRLSQSTEVVLFRIIQELINNAFKHAGAKDIYVQLLKNENELALTVEDNGIGFDTRSPEKLKGAGFKNILSRVEYLSGKLDIQSTINTGTSVHIEFKV